MANVVKEKLVVLDDERRRRREEDATVAPVLAALSKRDLRAFILAGLAVIPETEKDRPLRAMLVAAFTFEGTTIDDVVEELSRLKAVSKKGLPRLPLRFADPVVRVRWMVHFLKAARGVGIARQHWRSTLAELIGLWFPDLPNAHDPQLKTRVGKKIELETDPMSAVDKALDIAGASVAERRKWVPRHKERRKRK